MTMTRVHEIGNGRAWGTVSESLCGVHGPSIIVPISQLEGMKPQEMAATITRLVDEAKITGILQWLDWLDCNFFANLPCRDDRQKFFREVCIHLGYRDEYAAQFISEMEENLMAIEHFKNVDDEMKDAYSKICDLLDGAFDYLNKKRSRLTSGQKRAKTVITRLRHGCELCGLLGGNHTQSCTKFRNTSAKNLAT